jgi:hypothetical protein
MRAHPSIFFLVGEVLLIGASGFAAGFLWPHPSPALTLFTPPAPVVEIPSEPSLVEPADQGTANTTGDEPTPVPAQQGQFVASKSGAKYHPVTGCSYADRIKEENRIYFNTAKEAESAGYEPSSCISQ